MAEPSPSVKGKKDTPVKAASTPSSPKPEVIPKAALVDDSGEPDADVLAKAKAALDAARATLGGVGIGGGPDVTEGEVTLPENHWYGVNGDAEILRATSKTVTVRLSGKFWGSRQWAFDQVEEVITAVLPDVKLKIEEAAQLKDLYLRDVFSDADAWEVRKRGPQYVNERGIQIAQPFNADGSIKTLAEENVPMGGFDEGALKAGIEEMMVDAMSQQIGGFLDSSTSEELRAEVDAEIAAKAKADENILSVTRTDPAAPKEQVELKADAEEKFDIQSEKVGKALGGNPMFEKMANALEAEPGAVEEMMELLDRSNGNLFAVMMNPKFQQLANKMMANPELMQMMQDPAMLQSAMKSADDIGLTKELGLDQGQGAAAAKEFAAKATDAVKEGLGVGKEAPAAAPSSDTPEWLQAKEAEVRAKVRGMSEESVIKKAGREERKASNLAEDIATARSKISQDSFFTEAGGVRAKGEFSPSEFSIDEIMDDSSSSAPAPFQGGGMSDAASSASNELALYAVGFVVGVGGIVLFLAVQLGILDIPFLPKDLPGVSTPASRRMAAPQGKAPVADKVVPVDDGDF